tara:strand:+ start:71 stop:505 length:435 start_codon:yes stop_codon:yes gene_type:complete
MNINRHLRSQYPFFYKLSTRWKDNDVYGHINNVIYYEYFDTAVNKWLIENNLLDYKNGEQIGYIVKSNCDYFSPISHPCDFYTGIRVSKIGNSSVVYEIAIFLEGDDIASAQGSFTHVYVSRKTQKSCKLEDNFKKKLKTLLNQ